MLQKAQVVQAFERLSDHLGAAGVIGEIHLMGGAVMMLAFQARQSTKDVDAIFAPAREIREAAARVADEMGIDRDWLNDGAKGFASERGDYSDRVLPQYAHVRLLTPTPEYMLAMKVIAARVGETDDKADIKLLLSILGLTSAEDVFAIVQRYYPPSAILPRSSYLIDEILQEAASQ